MEPTDVDKLIGELEVGVDRLRSLYEQYFMGFEKLEPTVPRKDIDRRVHALRKEQIRNTALRFRFQMILQRYNTYQTHWQRICREMENGTYKRHLTRAQRRFGTEGPTPPTESVLPPEPTPPTESVLPPEPTPPTESVLPPEPAAPGRPPAPSAPAFRPPAPSAPTFAEAFRPQPGAALPADLATQLAELDREFAPASPVAGSTAHVHRPALQSPAATTAPAPRVPPPLPVKKAPPPVPSISPERKAAPPLPAAAPRPPHVPPPVPPAAPKSNDGLGETRMRQIYAEYIAARQKHNEPTANLPYETVVRNLRESSARLREKHGKAVDFEVMVKDGKTYLRPVVK